jgi:hypothetical protein
VEPRQYVHYDVVEGDVWHTSPPMLNLKYLWAYRMTFLLFNHLVSELMPFLQPKAVTFVRLCVLVRKQIALVVYRLAHGISCSTMSNLYGVGESIIRKYTEVVFRILASRNGLLKHMYMLLQHMGFKKLLKNLGCHGFAKCL